MEPELIKAVFDTCDALHQSHSDNTLLNSIHDFASKVLPVYAKTIAPQDEKMLEQAEQLIRQISSDQIKLSTLRRIMGKEGEKAIPPASYRNQRIKQLLVCYVQVFEQKGPTFFTDHKMLTGVLLFPEKVKKLLADKVNNFCSKCGQVTQAADVTPDETLRIGDVGCIHTPGKGSPRYNGSLTPDELIREENGIWLCLLHATHVNSRNGGGYTADTLRLWKKTREELMRKCLLNEMKITITPNFLSGDGQEKTGRRINRFFAQKELFFTPADQEIQEGIINEMTDISTFLEETLVSVLPNTILATIVTSMQRAVNYFLEQAVGNRENTAYLLDATRNIIGINFARIANLYDVRLSPVIKKILPGY